MSLVVAIDSLSFLLLLWAFVTVWKERKHFYSIKPLIPAVAFLSIGRLCDILVEHPSFRLSDLLRLAHEPFQILFGTIGNATDVIGISLLIFGFVKIIKFERLEKKHIANLETLLPICSNCKNYRTEDGQWLPIERFLSQSGAPRLTHSLCPDCMKKLYGNLFEEKSPPS